MSTIFLPMRAPGRSAPVSMAFTPGNLSALDTSIFFMRPCAIGLRKTFAHNISGSVISTAYTASPPTFCRPSTLGLGMPMLRILLMASHLGFCHAIVKIILLFHRDSRRVDANSFSCVRCACFPNATMICGSYNNLTFVASAQGGFPIDDVKNQMEGVTRVYNELDSKLSDKDDV